LNEEETWPIVQALKRQPRNWVDFMMRFELGLEKPQPGRALTSALTIAGAYIAGGLIPLAPYIFASTASTALLASVTLTLIALLIFGFVKGRFTGTRPLRSALQTALIGSVAAGAAFAIARLISG
jgi:VIT1/CCC1 family predicted Fe2+/Mn2+ transporter